MVLISERDRRKLEEFFRQRLVRPVRLVLFTQQPSLVWTPWSQPCQFCKETEQLVQELTQLSPLLEADIHDIDHEGTLAERYGVDKVPALIVTDGNIANIRYFGIPAGMEFTALIEDMVMVSQGTTNLSREVREKIRRIQKPVLIQVFVTPTCPYCPRAVRTAHQLNFDGGRSSRRSAPSLWLVCHLFTIAGNGDCVPTPNSCGSGCRTRTDSTPTRGCPLWKRTSCATASLRVPWVRVLRSRAKGRDYS
jgi:glutaredoxin-like protein